MSEPVAKPQFQPKSALLPPDSVPSQIAYGLSDMSICDEREPTPKSSNLCKKAGFATGSVSWHQQWALFAQNFHHGKAHISLAPYNSPHTLRLLPGPGFGDLSHPTTQLMLSLMHPHIANQPILDIGTGSGILTLAALLLGARSAIGIDIDPSALTHARANARLNNLTPHFSLTLPKTLPPQNILLLNMIFPEQKIVNPPTLNPHAKLWIVSGILAEQKKAYLQQTEQWGWTPLSEHTKDGWMGWIFTCKLPQKTRRFSGAPTQM